MITIIQYQSRWPDEFRELAGHLRSTLGNDALRIDHIGSTSVVGLAAKDILDVQIAVTSFTVVDAWPEKLKALGFVRNTTISADHVPPHWQGTTSQWEKRFFHSQQPRPVNMHVRIKGRANAQYALLFRDFLRADPMAAQAYGQLKGRLAEYLGDRRGAYTEVKDPVCDIIMAGAYDWAKRNGWNPGPSDG